jgi:hypothetical protein
MGCHVRDRPLQVERARSSHRPSQRGGTALSGQQADIVPALHGSQLPKDVVRLHLLFDLLTAVVVDDQHVAVQQRYLLGADLVVGRGEVGGVRAGGEAEVGEEGLGRGTGVVEVGDAVVRAVVDREADRLAGELRVCLFGLGDLGLGGRDLLLCRATTGAIWESLA